MKIEIIKMQRMVSFYVYQTQKWRRVVYSLTSKVSSLSNLKYSKVKFQLNTYKNEHYGHTLSDDFFNELELEILIAHPQQP